MGRSSSPQTAQRLSFLIVCYLQRAFDRDFPAALATMSVETQGIINRWIAKRLEAFPGVPDQARPAFFAVLQDDFTVAAIGYELVSWLGPWVYSVLESELRIQLSRKPAAPFSQVFRGIGATYDLRGSTPFFRPNTTVLENLQTLLTDFLLIPRPVSTSTSSNLSWVSYHLFHPSRLHQSPCELAIRHIALSRHRQGYRIQFVFCQAKQYHPFGLFSPNSNPFHLSHLFALHTKSTLDIRVSSFEKEGC